MKAVTQILFRIYIAGGAPNSQRALSNLATLCRKYLPERHRIEIIDVTVDGGKAVAQSIFLTPTVVRVSPEPSRRVVGDLSDSSAAIQALGLDAPP